MERKAVCKTCTSDLKPFQGQFAIQYTWNVSFENGDKGMIKTNTTNPPFETGKECDYDIEEVQKKDGSGTYFKIKKVQKKEFKQTDPTVKLKSYAVSYANRFVINGIIPRPSTPQELNDETNDKWNEMLVSVSKFAKSFYKEMIYDCNVYGFKNIDVIGVSLSNAIDARIAGKIRKDMIFPYYRNLLDSVLVKQEQPQTESK